MTVDGGLAYIIQRTKTALYTPTRQRRPSRSKPKPSAQHQTSVVLSAEPDLRPLPVVPKSSDLHLAPYLTPPTSSPAFSIHPTPLLPAHTQKIHFAIDPSTSINGPVHSNQIHDEPYIIPSLQHPNSPYMPWTSSVRSQILRPLTPTSSPSVPSGYYSRPLSRSGAQAPEPPTSLDNATRTKHNKKPPRKALHTFKHIGSALKRNIEGFARGVEKYTRRKPSIVIPNYLDLTSSEDPSECGLTYSSATHPTPSVLSISPSSDFETLAEWLQERNRSDSVAPSGPMMTLEEYERQGSWIDLVPSDLKKDGRICGKGDCNMHSPCGFRNSRAGSEFSVQASCPALQSACQLASRLPCHDGHIAPEGPVTIFRTIPDDETVSSKETNIPATTS